MAATDIMAGEAYYLGSTFEATTIVVNNNETGVEVPIDLTGADVKMQWRTKEISGVVLEWNLTNVLSIENTILTIAKHIPAFVVGELYCDLRIKFVNEDVWTGVGGFSINVQRPYTR